MCEILATVEIALELPANQDHHRHHINEDEDGVDGHKLSPLSLIETVRLIIIS